MGQKMAAALFITLLVSSVAHAQIIIYEDGFESGWLGRWFNAPWEPRLYLWEVDADTLGTDDAEFIELWNRTGVEIDFTKERYYVLLINGSDDLTYDAYQLIGNLAVDEIYLIDTLPANSIQNGPDGVLLVRCNSCTSSEADFPNDYDVGIGTTFLTAGGNTATKIDALAYDTDDPDDSSLWAKLNAFYQYNENFNGNKDFESNNRMNFDPDWWAAIVATPGVW